MAATPTKENPRTITIMSYQADPEATLASIRALHQQDSQIACGYGLIGDDMDSAPLCKNNGDEGQRRTPRVDKEPEGVTPSGESPATEEPYKAGLKRINGMVYRVERDDDACTLTFSFGSKLKRDDATANLRDRLDSLHGVHKVSFFEPDDYAFSVAYGRLFRAEYIVEMVVDAIREWDGPELPQLDG